MFKCNDYVVGEIIESDSKEILLNAINERIEDYKEQGKKLGWLFINNVYYITEM